MITRDDIRCYFETRNYVLWGRAFDIHAEDGRERAVDFVDELIRGITELKNYDATSTIHEMAKEERRTHFTQGQLDFIRRMRDM